MVVRRFTHDPMTLFHVHARRECAERHGFVLVGQLLRANRERDVDLPRRHGQPGQIERGRARRAGVVNVDNGCSHQRRVPQSDLAADRLLPGNKARKRIGEVNHADTRRIDAGILQGLLQRFLGQRPDAPVLNFPKAV